MMIIVIVEMWVSVDEELSDAFFPTNEGVFIVQMPLILPVVIILIFMHNVDSLWMCLSCRK